MQKKYRKYLIVFSLYIVLGIMYFATAFTQGLLIAPGDSFVQNYPHRYYYSQMLKNGEFSFWLPYEFLGISFVGILQVGVFYPLNFIYLFLSESTAFNISIILHSALGALFTYMYAKHIKLNNFPAFMAGLVFGFAGFVMAHKAHVSMANAAIWLPLLVLLFEKIRTTLNYKYIFGAAVIIAIQVLAGHFQITVYTLFFLALYVIVYSFKKETNVKKFMLLALISVILGMILSSPQIISTFELSREAWRVDQGYNYFTEFSFPPFMVLTFIFPYIFGGGYGGEYWGAWNLTELIAFVGIFPLIIGITVFFTYKKYNFHIMFWGITIIFSTLLALGGYTPLYKIFYHIPVYNLFRVSARHWLEFSLAISILFGFGIQYLFYNAKEKKQFINRLIKVFIHFTIVLLLVLWGVNNLIDLNYLNTNISSLAVDAFSLNNKALIIPLIFLGIYIILLILIKYINFKNRIYFLMISVVVFFELFSFGRFHENEWISIEAINEPESIDSSLNYLLENPTGNRSFYTNEFGPHLLNLNAKVNKLNGYDPLIPNDLNVLTGMYSFGQTKDDYQLIKNNVILSMFSTQYIFSKTPLDTDNLLGNIQQNINKDDILLNKFQFNSNVIAKEDSYIFESKLTEEVSMLNHVIDIEPNTFYEISFEAMSNEKVNGPLYVDFYGEIYDNPTQEFIVNAKDLDKDFKKFSGVINSEQTPEGEINLRLFTFSQRPVEVKNISLKKLNNFNPQIMYDVSNENSNQQLPLYNLEGIDENGLHIYENLNVLPKVYSVTSLEPVNSIEQVRDKLISYEVNPKKTALIYESDFNKITTKSFSNGDIEITEYNNDNILVHTNFEENGFIVISDGYTKDWKAFVDGVEVPLYKVNGLLRGLEVPSGNHVVEIKYIPTSLFIFMFVSVITFIILLSGLFINIKKKRFIKVKGQ